MTIEKLKELVGANAVEKLVRDTAVRVAREGDWEKLEELVQFAKENGLNVEAAASESRQVFTAEDALYEKISQVATKHLSRFQPPSRNM
jgi:hypothetical protein